MYRQATGSIYPKGDPYSLTVGDAIIPRHIVKTLSSILINVPSIKSATPAIRNHYGPVDKPTKEQQQKTDEFYSITKIVSVKDIANAYMDKHQAIAFHFLMGKDMGNHVQYWESCIVMNVINELTTRGIPVLTVFDSFIIAKQHEALLRKIMFDVSTTTSIAA